MANTISAEFLETVEDRVVLRAIRDMAFLIERLTADGRVYGQVKLSPELAQAKRQMLQVPQEEF